MVDQDRPMAIPSPYDKQMANTLQATDELFVPSQVNFLGEETLYMIATDTLISEPHPEELFRGRHHHNRFH